MPSTFIITIKVFLREIKIYFIFRASNSTFSSYNKKNEPLKLLYQNLRLKSKNIFQTIMEHRKNIPKVFLICCFNFTKHYD